MKKSLFTFLFLSTLSVNLSAQDANDKTCPNNNNTPLRNKNRLQNHYLSN